MSPGSRRPLPPISTLRRRLADSALINRQFFVSTAVVYAVVLVFNRLERVDAEFFPIVVTWIGSQLFLLLSGFALRSALRRTPTSEWNILAVLGAGFLIAVLHSELTEELLIFQGVPIAPTSEWFHVVAGLFGVVVYYLFAATWGSYRDWKEARSELSTTIAAIESLRSGAQDFHKAESEQLSQRIRETVLPNHCHPSAIGGAWPSVARRGAGWNQASA